MAKRAGIGRAGIGLSLMLAIGMLGACSKQEVNTTTAQTADKTKTQDNNAPQSKHSKIELPVDFPKDLPLPENIQLETLTTEDDAATLDGLLSGKMKKRMESLHYKMLDAGWKANLVMPQGSQTLMHYTKDGRSIIIELNESVGDVVTYSLSYELVPEKVAAEAVK